MPGLIVFRRRWSAGSDDLVVPSSILFSAHLICFAVLVCSVSLIDYPLDVESVRLLWYFQLGHIAILSFSIFVELGICIVSMRGSILDTGPRATMHYWLYMKLVALVTELIGLSLGIVWIVQYFTDCPVDVGKKIMFAMVICSWSLIAFVLVTIWCTFDAAGRSWVKMKKYQRSMRESESRFNYKRSGSMNRNWRQRKVIRAYQDSWDHRCRLLFCCMGGTERNRSSFADIAKLLSDFFRELDVVPSDVVAGLVLLRKFQKIERQAIVRQRKHGTYEFLSGVPITERTRFLRLNDPLEYDHFQTVIHYMHYALAAYGWPMFLMTHSHTGLCQLVSECCCMTCRCCGGAKERANPVIVDDNCCSCNYAAMNRMMAACGDGDVEVIYTTFHVDVGETPFFVAVDYAREKVVVSIRGTLSMQDVLTDLNAEGDVLPLEPPREDWLGHKGMVQAAVYIRQKLREEGLVERALQHNPARGTERFDLVLVGHSLGAGTAAILAILMKADWPTVECYSFSPPGGLLSMPAVEYSKAFVTSVVVGKDVVPRIGLHQMETLRADLINAIKRSVDPKWKTIACTLICCCCGPEPTSVVDMETHDSKVVVYEQQRTSARKTSAHPNDSSIALTLHNPLYPPGRIIHVVRHHPTAEEHKYEQGWRHVLKSREPVYQAIWVENTDFDEVLISPAMIQDHMPDTVLAALNKVITTFGPRKPQRLASNANSSVASDVDDALAGELSRAASPTNGAPQSHDASAIYPQLHGSRTTAATSAAAAAVAAASSATAHSSAACRVPAAMVSRSASITPTSSTRRFCLETSFASLQSPDLNAGFALASGTPSTVTAATCRTVRSATPRSHTSASNHGAIGVLGSSSKDSVYTRNGNTSGHHHAAVIVPAGKLPSTTAAPRSVAFSNHPPTSQRLFSRQQSATRRTNSEQLAQQPLLRQRIDLVHDDWYGMAPLASPETLSEISSISSRTSLVNTVTSSIEKYLQCVAFYPTRNGSHTGGPLLSAESHNGDEQQQLTAAAVGAEDTQLRTPRVMRRTPKIAGNLAGCADDWRSVDTYKRFGKVFVTAETTNGDGGASSSSSSGQNMNRNDAVVVGCGLESSEQSFESAYSMKEAGHNNGGHRRGAETTTMTMTTTPAANSASRSADHLDDDGGEILSAAKLTWSDGDILGGDACQSRCPHCPCRYYRSGSDCCPQLEHAFCTRPYAVGGTVLMARNRAAEQRSVMSRPTGAEKQHQQHQQQIQQQQQQRRRAAKPQSEISSSSDATFYSAESMTLRQQPPMLAWSAQAAVPPPSTTRLEAGGVLESHFPCTEVSDDEDGERSTLLTPRSVLSASGSTVTQKRLRLLGHDVDDGEDAQQQQQQQLSPSLCSRRRKNSGHHQQQAAATARWTDDDEDAKSSGGGGGGGGAFESHACTAKRVNETLPLLAKTLAASLNSRGLSSKRNRNVIYPVLSSYSRNASPVHRSSAHQQEQRQTISSSSSSVASTKGGESSV